MCRAFTLPKRAICSFLGVVLVYPHQPLKDVFIPFSVLAQTTDLRPSVGGARYSGIQLAHRIWILAAQTVSVSPPYLALCQPIRLTIRSGIVE